VRQIQETLHQAKHGLHCVFLWSHIDSHK